MSFCIVVEFYDWQIQKKGTNYFNSCIASLKCHKRNFFDWKILHQKRNNNAFPSKCKYSICNVCIDFACVNVHCLYQNKLLTPDHRGWWLTPQCFMYLYGRVEFGRRTADALPRIKKRVAVGCADTCLMAGTRGGRQPGEAANATSTG